jgi:SPX domain protein involved in polyphosphate accumulation
MGLQLDFQRYEYKYPIPEHLHDAIVQFVSCYTRPDAFTQTGERNRYTITSLYLDSPDLTFHRAKAHRELNRVKLRIRTYGEQSDGPVFLEIKRKIKDVIFKRRVGVVGPDWYDRWQNGEEFLSDPTNPRNRDVAQEFLKLMDQYSAQPAMLVRYTREAYESLIDDYARVTFDRKIRCHMPDHYHLNAPLRSWMDVDDPMTMGMAHSGSVLELKFANHPPFWMIELVKRFGLRRRGFSKYSSSVNRGLETYWPTASVRVPVWETDTPPHTYQPQRREKLAQSWQYSRELTNNR